MVDDMSHSDRFLLEEAKIQALIAADNVPPSDVEVFGEF